MKYFDYFAVKKIIEDTASQNDSWRVIICCNEQAGKVNKCYKETPVNLDGVNKSSDWTQAFIDIQRTLADDFWGTMTLSGVKHTLLKFETSRVEKP